MAGIIGLCVGSFLNVVIYRVPLGMSVAKPASHCPTCSKPIKWYDNIPVLSYTLLGGKCRNCKTHIPFRYTAVEISNALLWLLSVRCFLCDGILPALIAMALSSVLICVLFIDLENMIIPDRFQIILAVLGIIAAVTDKSDFGGKFALSHIIGCVVGFAVFALVALVFTKITGAEALGGGDVKLAAVMGLFLGWQKLLLAVFIASLSASVLLIILKYKNNDGKTKGYPFAPFLSAGFLIAHFFGGAVINSYISLFS